MAEQYRYLNSGASHDRPSPVRQVYAQATIRRILNSGHPVRMVEIGAWCGFSTVLWAEAIARFGSRAQVAASSIHCIDPWDSYFANVDLARNDHYRNMDSDARSGAAFDTFKHNILVAQRHYGIKISFEKAMSTEALPRLHSHSSNFIYIDGSHYYHDVKFDINEAARIVETGGYVAGDDLERQIPEVPEADVRAHLGQDFLHEEKRPYHPGVTLAVHEAIGVVESYDGYWIAERTESAFRTVKLSGWRYFPPGSLSTGDRKRFVKVVAQLMSDAEPGLPMWFRRITAKTLRM